MMRRDRQALPASAGSTTVQASAGQSTTGQVRAAAGSAKAKGTAAPAKGSPTSGRSKTTPVQPKVLFSTTCWSCGQAVQKPVTRRNLRQRHFSWMCTDCDVSWWGPGQEV